MKLPTLEPVETPKGKRTIRANIYGNLVGYVAGKRWIELGDPYSAMDKEAAEEWVKTGKRP